jgi:preprotein translocase subunit SecB
MISTEPTIAFKFKNFRVSKFSFEESEEQNVDLEMGFHPSGIYDQTTGLYQLFFTFTASEKATNKKVIKVKSVSEFLFDKPYSFEEIPSFFFTNSIPIVFPYMRAFISTLTLQANANVLMLGLIKFTNAAEPLRENTEVINS